MLKRVAMGVAVLVLLGAAGCEKAVTGRALEVTPPGAVVAPRGSVRLTAGIPEAEKESRQLYYPLVWTVSNPSLGFMRDAAGDSAVYEAYNAEGVNTVAVRDQGGAEGIASVTQGCVAP